MIKILFVSDIDAAFMHAAVSFARKIAPQNIHVLGADLNNGKTDLVSQVKDVMQNEGMDIANQIILDYREINNYSIDILVNISSLDPDFVQHHLPGDPVQVAWQLKNFKRPLANDSTNVKKILDQIKQKIDEFFFSDYYRILIQSNTSMNMILNHLKDGIIIHDMKRRISYFNLEAERITGYNREDVIGKDCHEVFPYKFCGDKCSFCDSNFSTKEIQYPLNIKKKDNTTVMVNFSIKLIRDQQKVVGVIASFNYQDEKKLLDARKKKSRKINNFHGILSKNKSMTEIFDLVVNVAQTDVPVLIQGESGTGKELIAKALHTESKRKEQVFLPINCGALPENLLESELFGYVKGAFTGAAKDKKGRFELADKGTIFLDEIGDISQAMQVKLLRVLQDGTFEKLGDTRTIKTNVRIISASNKDLRQEIVNGSFREDLYYRLCVMPIYLPPLNQRKEDIFHLANFFIKENSIGKSPDIEISPSVLKILRVYNWPGNIRELQNIIQYALIKCIKNEITEQDLPEHILNKKWMQKQGNKYQMDSDDLNQSEALNVVRIRLSKENVLDAFRRTDGNKAKTARILGVSRATLYRFIKKYPELRKKYE